MQIDLSAITAYCESYSNSPGEVLQSLERESHLKTLAPQMLAGPWLGKFLQFISQMIKPHTILEIGSFTGYSGICLAEGLVPGGMLHMVEANPERASMIRRYLEAAGLTGSAALHIGRAEEIVPNLALEVDLALIDAGKRDNARHVELVLPKLCPGGFLLIDNTLWDGKVLAPEGDIDAEAIHACNETYANDPRVEQLILPIRDGVSILRKCQEN